MGSPGQGVCVTEKISLTLSNGGEVYKKMELALVEKCLSVRNQVSVLRNHRFNFFLYEAAGRWWPCLRQFNALNSISDHYNR